MIEEVVVPLERLHEPECGKILCYPRYDLKELRRRVRELENLGVQALEFNGEKRAFNMPVLGKGHVGVVVSASMGGQKVALKIRRVDANRSGMLHEAEMQRKANSAGVGPDLIDATDNFLVMEFVGGTTLPKWIEGLKERVESRIRHVLLAVLEQCWRLDKMNLDHGELSRAPKHIIIGESDKPCLVDFETASSDRRASNVTSICQYLFMGSSVARMIADRLGEIDKGELIKTLRKYKQKHTKEEFEMVLGACGLRKLRTVGC
ncbi:MAG: serine/threonine protein kinase [Candidatus Bathyarchaeota archaeon]|nr:MAG: serine/threonine protein kinase [Candidatus Bathyarchaeota archaeon]